MNIRLGETKSRVKEMANVQIHCRTVKIDSAYGHSLQRQRNDPDKRWKRPVRRYRWSGFIGVNLHGRWLHRRAPLRTILLKASVPRLHSLLYTRGYTSSITTCNLYALYFAKKEANEITNWLMNNLAISGYFRRGWQTIVHISIICHSKFLKIVAKFRITLKIKLK